MFEGVDKNHNWKQFWRNDSTSFCLTLFFSIAILYGPSVYPATASKLAYGHNRRTRKESVDNQYKYITHA